MVLMSIMAYDWVMNIENVWKEVHKFLYCKCMQM